MYINVVAVVFMLLFVVAFVFVVALPNVTAAVVVWDCFGDVGIVVIFSAKRDLMYRV